MTDQELADTLKARLSAWQGYMEQTKSRSPRTPTEEPPAESNAPETPAPNDTVAPIVAEPALIPESLIERYEQQIADLRAALEHERHQSRSLAETLAREQALRAAAPAQNTTSSTPLRRSGGDRPHERYNHAENELRSHILWVFVLIGIVCCLVFFFH